MKPITLSASEIRALVVSGEVELWREMKCQPLRRPFQIASSHPSMRDKWFDANPDYPRRGNMMRSTYRAPFAIGEIFEVPDSMELNEDRRLSTVSPVSIRVEQRDGKWGFVTAIKRADASRSPEFATDTTASPAPAAREGEA